MKVLNLDLSPMAAALTGKGINAKPKAIHKIGVSRRKKQLELKIKEIGESLAPDEDYNKFINELEELKKKFADRDDKGKVVEQEVPSQQGRMVKVPVVNERLDEYMEQVVVLRKKFSEAIESTKVLNDSYDELIMLESDIKLAPVILSDFVKEKTAYEELFGLFPIIKDFTEDKLFKKKVKIKFTISDVIGTSDSDSSGIADISKMNAFTGLNHWDLSMILVYNLHTVRKRAFELKKDKLFVNHKTKHDLERVKLCDIYAKKNINGEPMRNQNGYVLDDITEFNKGFNKLKIKNKKVISDYEKYLETEIEIELVQISDSLLSEIDLLLESDEVKISLDQAEILDYFV